MFPSRSNQDTQAGSRDSGITRKLQANYCDSLHGHFPARAACFSRALDGLHVSRARQELGAFLRIAIG